MLFSLKVGYFSISKSGLTLGFDNKLLCSSCDSEKPPAIGHCNVCNEDLCEVCTDAHKRVKATRGHPIVFFGKKTVSPNVETMTSSIAQLPQFMGGLIQPVNRGIVVQSDVMQVYQGAVEKAKVDSKVMINQATLGASQIDSVKAQVLDTKAKVEARYMSVRKEIQAWRKKFEAAIIEREATLLGR